MQTRDYVVGLSFDADPFQLSTVTAQNFYGAARNIERLRQNSDQLFVRRTVDRRRRDPHAQGAVVFSNHFTA